ncbi:MAG TPA: hemerythrin domain-containing protein [Steroidobacteraceae bacterium]|jgi:hemerythrin superfamily protein|nr:hemerythrin domain-containing protein [Steroidobacteraceae bacterium]
MSAIETILNAVAPRENEHAHREARAKAKAVAREGDWLAIILQHHEAIEAAFVAAKSAATAEAQKSAHKRLGVLLTGHSNAEESVIYPAMARANSQEHATKAYSEQATAKTEMALLESLVPMSREYLERLEHIRDAVAHHVYEEENQWFLDLKANVSEPEQATLGRRYQEEFDRYVGREPHADPYEPADPVEGVTRQHRVADSFARPAVPRD